mmetsp:Transcript_34953/g.104267  ORF Transcript_34953/g.104267 Transcript_34953/m.104267 type:complete len:262 (+) Transcript_34953:584-1369(+)
MRRRPRSPPRPPPDEPRGVQVVVPPSWNGPHLQRVHLRGRPHPPQAAESHARDRRLPRSVRFARPEYGPSSPLGVDDPVQARRAEGRRGASARGRRRSSKVEEFGEIRQAGGDPPAGGHGRPRGRRFGRSIRRPGPHGGRRGGLRRRGRPGRDRLRRRVLRGTVRRGEGGHEGGRRRGLVRDAPVREAGDSSPFAPAAARDSAVRAPRRDSAVRAGESDVQADQPDVRAGDAPVRTSSDGRRGGRRGRRGTVEAPRRRGRR